MSVEFFQGIWLACTSSAQKDQPDSLNKISVGKMRLVIGRNLGTFLLGASGKHQPFFWSLNSKHSEEDYKNMVLVRTGVENKPQGVPAECIM